MVKETDDSGGDQLAVVLDARASAEIAGATGSSFELALAAAGALVAQAHDDARRVRLVVAGPDGELVSASERAAVRRLLARARPAGERRPAEVLARLSAERVEVVTTRPADLLGTRHARRLGVVAIDPSSFDPAIARDAAALAALRAAGAHVQEVRRPEPSGRRGDAAGTRGAAPGTGCCSRSPRSSACCRRVTCRRPRSRRRGWRRSHCSPLRPHSPPGAPRGGRCS